MSQQKTKVPMVKLSLAVAGLLPLHAGPFVFEAAAQLNISCLQNMNFGNIHPCTGGGAIVVDPDEDVVTTGCIGQLGTVQQAQCRITTVIPQTNTITMSLTRTKIDLNSASAVRVLNFNLHTDSGGTNVTFPAASFTATKKVIGIGGKLNLTGIPTKGNYSGVLTVNVKFR